MAYSLARYISAGSAGPYSVPFPYRQRSDVTVLVNGASVPFVWTTSSTVTLNSAPVSGATIEIRRKTSEAVRLTQFTSVSQVDKDNLEAESLQSFYLAQEGIDSARDAKEKSLRVPDGEADPGPIPAAASRANRYLGFDADGNFALYTGEVIGGGSGTEAPASASYVVIGTNSTLTNERVLTAGTGLTLNDAGANNSVTLSIANDAVTMAMLANIDQNQVIGRVAGGTGDPKALTAAELVAIIVTADGPGSLIDADSVDGLQGANLVQTTRNINTAAGLEGGGTLSTDLTIGIAGGGVTNNMLQTMAQNRIKGRFSTGTGAPEDLTPAQLVSIVTQADGAGSGLDADTLDGFQGADFAVSGIDIIAGAGLSGGGDLTTDRTLSIANNGVTNAMLATVSTGTIKGRVTGGTGNVEDLTPSQVVGFLLSADGASSGLDADLLDGLQASDFVQTSRTITTNSPISGGGALSTNLTLGITTNGILDTHLAQVATNTFRGRVTAGTGNIENLSVTQATAMLNAYVGATAGTPGTKGLVPAAAAGDEGKFLAGDGTWQTGGGGGGGGAPIAGKYVAYGSDTGLSDERVLAVEASVLSLTDSGTPAGNITIGVATNGIANGKLATMAQATVKGRAAGAGTGSPSDLTPAEITAILDAFVGATGGSAGTKGAVPAPAAGEQTLYLRGDGTWAAPSGSGAPTSSQYVTLALDGTLTAERVLAVEASVLSLTDGGANGNVTIGIATNGVTNAKFRQGAALSVVGVTGNATANVADIAAGVDGYVLRRSGTALAFGEIATAGIANDAVTFAKVQNIATSRILGRTTAASGDIEELTVGAPLTLTGGALDFDETATLGNVARTTVRKNTGADVGSRRRLNFIEGTNVTLTVADDAGNEEVDITIDAAGGSGAPTGASYVVIGLDGTLSAERVLTAGVGIGLTDGGANGNATLAMNITGLSTPSGAVDFNADYVPIHSAADGTVRKLLIGDIRSIEHMIVACGDETTALTGSTSVAKVSLRMPYAFELTNLKASLRTAQASGATLVTLDVHKNGTTIFSTNPTFDNTETTTVTAATPRVFTSTPTTFAADDLVEFFCDNLQAASVAAGLKITMIGARL